MRFWSRVLNLAIHELLFGCKDQDDGERERENQRERARERERDRESMPERTRETERKTERERERERQSGKSKRSRGRRRVRENGKAMAWSCMPPNPCRDWLIPSQTSCVPDTGFVKTRFFSREVV